MQAPLYRTHRDPQKLGELRLAVSLQVVADHGLAVHLGEPPKGGEDLVVELAGEAHLLRAGRGVHQRKVGPRPSPERLQRERPPAA